MRFASILGSMLATSGLLAARIASPQIIPSQIYQTVRPVTSKNIGRDWLKAGRGNRYLPHQGEREMARRSRQMAAGQLRFIKHGPAQ